MKMNNTMHKIIAPLILLAGAFLGACGSDDNVVRIFEAAFPSNEAGLAEADETLNVVVNFSTPTLEAVTVTLGVEENGVTYGNAYETSPAIADGQVTITIPKGAESASFSVTRLVDFINEGNSVNFTLTSIAGEADPQIVGNSTFTVLFEEVIAQGGTINFETGGSTYPNQCYIDLSSFTQTAVKRDTWELAFYTGEANKVFLNGALLVAAAELSEFTDIDGVTSESTFNTPLTLQSYNQDTQEIDDVTVHGVSELMTGLPVSYGQYNNEALTFSDSKDGSNTAITEISTTAAENKVYLVAMGNEIPTQANTEGGINITGDQRGFYKVRILTNGDSYTLQYAEIDATTHTEVTISKNSAYHHVFFSLTNSQEVNVAPAKGKWDINMSGVFSYFGYDYGFGAALTFSDYVLHNTSDGAAVYQVIVGETTPTYEAFALADVEDANLETENPGLIGSGWRSVPFGPGAATIKTDRYYIIKDTDGNYFKLKFTAVVNEAGERGHAQCQYELL